MDEEEVTRPRRRPGGSSLLAPLRRCSPGQETQVCTGGRGGGDQPGRLHMAATEPPRVSTPWWWAHPGEGASEGAFSPTAGGSALALPVQRHADGTISPHLDVTSSEAMHAALDAATRRHDAPHPPYELGFGGVSGAVLARLGEDGQRFELPVHEMLSGDDAYSGGYWLRALGDTAVFGAYDERALLGRS